MNKLARFLGEYRNDWVELGYVGRFAVCVIGFTLVLCFLLWLDGRV